mgnify:FL=1
MKLSFFNISPRFLIGCLVAALCLSVQAGVIKVSAKLDSTVLLMGKQTALNIEITQDKGVQGVLLNELRDTLVKAVEIADRPLADTTDIENNRIQINKKLIIQSFDSGVYVLPPLQYLVGRDTILSNHVSLKVIPVRIDSMTTVHDYAPVADVKFRLLDFVPDFIADYWWLYFLILAIIALAIFVYYKWLRHGQIPLMPKKKIIPPYEEAIARLQQLKERKLWQNGQEKQYYTELTDILRVYITRRFGISATEMTSGQLLEALRTNEQTSQVQHRLSETLEISDLVKFANISALADDNEISFRRVQNFVDDTKPAPEPEETDEKGEKDDKKDAKAETKKAEAARKEDNAL